MYVMVFYPNIILNHQDLQFINEFNNFKMIETTNIENKYE